MRVIIYANGKTGSTALAYRLKTSLPNHDLLFEPKPLSSVSATRKNIIVKYLHKRDHTDTRLLNNYDKRIILVRHPFDMLISWTIYFFSTNLQVLDDNTALSLSDKLGELESGHIPFRDLHNFGLARLGLSTGHFTKEMSGLRDLFAASEEGFFFPFRYEDLIQESFSSLSDFIGTPILDGEIEKSHEHVTRTKTSDNWHRWMTKEDVEYFASYPEISRYAQTFSYDLTLPPDAALERSAQEGSEYFLMQINRVREKNGAPPLPPRPQAMEAATHFAKTVAALGKGDTAAAFDSALSAALYGTPIALPYVVAARGLLGQGHFIAAEAASRRALACSPRLAQGWHGLGEALLKQSRHAEALKAAQTAVEQEPSSAEHHMLAAMILMDMRRWEQAETSVRAALGSPNSMKGYHKSLAIVLSELGRNDEALAEVDKAIRSDPGIWHYHALKARICLDLAHWSEAGSAILEGRSLPAPPAGGEVFSALEERLDRLAGLKI